MDMTPQKPRILISRRLSSRVRGSCTVELGDEISEMQHLDHGEMARVLLE